MDSKTYNDSNANDLSQSSTVSDGRLDNSGVHHVPHLDLSDCDDSGDVDSISGEINPPIEDNRIRLFVALFDYDPESMSPNVECLDEELPFKEGQIIKVNKPRKPIIKFDANLERCFLVSGDIIYQDVFPLSVIISCHSSSTYLCLSTCNI